MTGRNSIQTAPGSCSAVWHAAGVLRPNSAKRRDGAAQSPHPQQTAPHSRVR